MAAAAEERRLGREARRDVANGGRQTTDEDGSRSELAELGHSMRARVMQTSPSAAATIGAAVGLGVGLMAAGRLTGKNDGNVISGDIAVHLLNRIELLTIKLQVRHARRGGRTEIDVHRVEADASSRGSSRS
jgi:hypothetical protein